MRSAVVIHIIALTLTFGDALRTFGIKERYDVSAGQYSPDNSGAYDQEAGRYQQDNSGAYRPDASGDYYAGQYIHDNSGAYVHDNSGDYVPDYNPYIHQEGNFGNDNGNIGGSGGFGGGSGGGGGTGGAGFGVSGNRPTVTPVFIPTNKPVPAPAPAPIDKPVNIPANIPVNIPPRPAFGSTGSGSGIAPAGGFGNPAPLKQGNAAGLYDNRNYAIIRKIEQVEQDGYHYLYETENGILAEEEGHLANKGTDNEVMKAKGFFTYTGPDAVVYKVDYTADENGFVPIGAHLPTPPPIPEAILKSLEYQRSLGVL